MRTLVILLAAAVFALTVIFTWQTVQLKSKVYKLEKDYHYLNIRLNMLYNPELVRPYYRRIWEELKK